MKGKKGVEARFVVKEHQEPDLEDGLVKASRCVSLRALHL